MSHPKEPASVGQASQPVPVHTIDDLERLVGYVLAPSPWVVVTQEMVDMFAKVTMDDQWIHVDIERAKASQYGATIAHGFLVLSLGPALLRTVLDLAGVTQGINYGCNKVRFPAPTPVGAEVRLQVSATAIERVGNSARVTFLYTFERRGTDRPVCVAECISLLRFVDL